ncbi:NAD(P)H-dependent oxidoreductase subunit E, partial [candidate division WOR-3 bacterium]|nr:NAD(P)H-dependent oxidoreductase subunit E [candidate division WOR-3 bacterium]
MSQLDKTFPTLDCSACILTPKMSEVGRHPNIELLSYSEVEDVSGYIGNFTVTVKKKPRYVDEEKCTGCGDCITACPVRYEPIERPPITYPDVTEEEKKNLDKIIDKYGREKESLIQILQDINLKYRYLPSVMLKYVSLKIGVPLSRVYHVATFYPAFSLVPRGKHTIKVCMGTACHTRGAPIILEEIERQLGIKSGETTKDLQFTLETVNCLGCCALAPVVVVDEDYHSITPSKVEKLLKKYQKES